MRFRVTELALSPGVFASVMATGIVSISARDHHYSWISGGLDVVASAVMVVLTVGLVLEIIVRQHFPFQLSDPDVVAGLFTFVAACTVLVARFDAHRAAVLVLAGVAWFAWVVLAAATVRSMWPFGAAGLRDRANGAWELISVATSGIAIVTAQLAFFRRDVVLLHVGIFMWLTAIGVYCLITWLILWRAAAAPSDDIWKPHSWILMGGLAIATLAGDSLHRAAVAIVTAHWLTGAIRSLTVVTWVVATLWIPPLIYQTVRHLQLRFTGAWWALVFPLGMYSTATFTMGVETSWRPFWTASFVAFWIAFAAWLLVALAAVAAVRRVRTR